MLKLIDTTPREVNKFIDMFACHHQWRSGDHAVVGGAHDEVVFKADIAALQR
jgi:hypothetical protein